MPLVALRETIANVCSCSSTAYPSGIKTAFALAASVSMQKVGLAIALHKVIEHFGLVLSY